MNEISIPDATREPEAYFTTLLEVLGNRDPIAILRATPGLFVDIVAHSQRKDLEARPVEGEWSVAEIIGHVVDSEIAYSLRWRLVLTKETPSYPAHDERALVALPKPSLDHVLALFGELRTYDLWLLEHVAPGDLKRMGIHEEQGLEPLDRMIRKLAGHDLAHLNQIDRAIAAVTSELAS